MDFSPTARHAALREAIVKMAQAELGRDLVGGGRAGRFDAAGWKHCAKAGLQGLTLPEQYGGRGADALDAAIAFEALGYGSRDNGLNFAIGAHLFGCAMPIAVFGSDEQKQRFLPGLASGEKIAALAMTEADAGSDAYSLRASAARRGKGYVLNGRKIFVTNAPLADLVVVLATVDAAKKAHGVSAFVVEKGTAGLKCGTAVEKMGLRTAQMGAVDLEDCVVGEENRLGREGSGLAFFQHAMEWERGLILAPALGAMQRTLEACRVRARSRQQFGKPIGAFQHVATKLVDMQLGLESARLLLYKAAALKAHGKSAAMEAAMAKLAASEAWVRAAQDAIQIHGGEGYLTATEVERELRDALAGKLYSGTSEIQRDVIAHWMGVGDRGGA
jgi:alkylation response protein AidB-like acyl-CoA dehydrogenase